MDDLHGVIDDAAIDRMRKERAAALAVTIAAMGRKHLTHPANRIESPKQLAAKINNTTRISSIRRMKK